MCDENRYAYALLYSSKVSREMFPLLCSVFQTDAAHCNNTTKSTMFTFYGRDANRGEKLVAVMFVADNESEATWKMFFKFIRESINSSWEGNVVISDQEKGCKKALKEEIPQVHHFHCSFHRMNVIICRIPHNLGVFSFDVVLLVRVVD